MDIKTSIRTSIFTFLSSHVAHTPLLTVRYRLLSMLNEIGKVGTTARHTILLPAIQQWTSLPANEVARVCATEKVEVVKLDQAYLRAITARDQPGLVYLVSVASGETGVRPSLLGTVFERLRELWPALKSNEQQPLAKHLLGLSLSTSSEAGSQSRASEAIGTLRELQLSTEVLISIIDSLPDALTTQEQPPAAKRRRTSKAEMVKFNTKDTEELMYLQGLVLGGLSSIVNGLKDAGAHKIDRSVIRADLIVDCVRSTPNPQIHNSALLLISGLASYAPDLVLHSVMPIFTFMGNTLLRQSDEYSAHVIDQTITRVIPPLVESLRRKNQDVVAGAAELLLSFTTSFEHIPPHRRLRLFSHLVTTLGPEESLFAVMAMLVERYHSTEKLVGSPVGYFIADLMALFEPHTNLTAASKFVDVIIDSLQPKRALSEKILSVNESSPSHIETTAVNLLETLSELLKNPQFSRKLATALQQDEATATSLRETFCDLWGKIIRLSHDTVGHDQLQFVSANATSVLLELLPTADFVECAVILLENRDDKLRRDILKSIEIRVSLEKHGDARSRRVLLDFLPRITDIIQSTSDVPLKYTALACIDQISDKYGKKDSDAIASAARVVADLQALGSDNDPIRVMSLLCLISAVEVLRDEFIPLLPQVLTTALHYIDLSTRKDSSNEKLHNAAFALVGSVLEHIPYMFSGKYLDTILRLSHKSANAGLSEEANDNRAHVYQLAAKQLDAKECFAAIKRNWDGATKQGYAALREHLDMLNTALTRHPKSVVIRNSQTLFSLFIKAFDLRHACAVDSLSNVYDDEQMENLEALINEIAISMTLKLNDTAFRPFFVRLVEWASEGLPKKDKRGRVLRSTSLFVFLEAFFDRLKSIVTSYSSYMLVHAVHILQNTSFDVAEGQTLLRAVLGALARSLQYDEDGIFLTHNNTYVSFRKALTHSQTSGKAPPTSLPSPHLSSSS
ncbi:snoRNA-binding rRNA-processing protein utp10 [Cryomyces antarcticus]|uniref:U3 small nucleolar RNA-associated protein 10 n=1 Tax=Cryomyces antarcticus TaxID=329879 RepID=A0ABR0LSQ2_9PEZI|nr:snoRNA-binding rRNA-processing protein utp10 [Cryomyces antarcticus]